VARSQVFAEADIVLPMKIDGLLGTLFSAQTGKSVGRVDKR
jgi:hypothetical protein